MTLSVSGGTTGPHAARQALGGELEASGCRALLVIASSSRDPDLAPFVGDAHLGESFLIAASGDERPPHLGFLTAMERQEAAATGCRLLPPAQLGLAELLEQRLSPVELWADVLRRGLEAAAVGEGRIAVAGRPAAGVLLAAARSLGEAGWELVDGAGLARRLRKRKTPAELTEVRRVAAATVEAFCRVAELLAAASTRDSELWLAEERLSAGRLRAEVATLFARHELEQPEGNIVAAGADSAVPHTRGDGDRALRAGESLIVDLFPRGRLFADCTRTFCVGRPPAALAAAHEAVFAALAEAYRQAGTGTVGWDLQRRTCELFEAAGYATVRQAPETVQGYVHGLGHGVGYELHELPSFRCSAAGLDGTLAAGDLFTLEPGLYDPAAGWGLRLEDLCWLGPSGVESLTPAPYALDPRVWIA
jgi:Xaa-Pro aminopeptidase